MSLTVDQLKALSFGYLTGEDLLQYSPPQLLISKYEIDNGSLQKGCNIAYDEIDADLSTRYDLSTEFAKKGFTNGAATATVAAGIVTAAVITNAGTNYGTAPTITFVGGGGSGAAATAAIASGSISAINITSGGTGYTAAPTIVITGGAAADTRASLLVKIASLFAIRNILGNAQNISEKMLTDFAWADKAIRDLRNGQKSLKIVTQSDVTTVGSPAVLISSSFNTLG